MWPHAPARSPQLLLPASASSRKFQHCLWALYNMDTWINKGVAYHVRLEVHAQVNICADFELNLDPHHHSTTLNQHVWLISVSL